MIPTPYNRRRRMGAADPPGMAITPGPINPPMGDYMGRPMLSPGGYEQSSLGNEGPQMPIAPGPVSPKGVGLAALGGLLFGGGEGAASAATGFLGGAQQRGQEDYQRGLGQYDRQMKQQQQAVENYYRAADLGFKQDSNELDWMKYDAGQALARTRAEAETASERDAFLKNLRSVPASQKPAFLGIARQTGTLQRYGLDSVPEAQLMALQDEESRLDPAGLLSAMANLSPEGQAAARPLLAANAGRYGVPSGSILNMPVIGKAGPQPDNPQDVARKQAEAEYERQMKIYENLGLPAAVRQQAAGRAQQLASVLGNSALGPNVPAGQPDPTLMATDPELQARLAQMRENEKYRNAMLGISAQNAGLAGARFAFDQTKFNVEQQNKKEQNRQGGITAKGLEERKFRLESEIRSLADSIVETKQELQSLTDENGKPKTPGSVFGFGGQDLTPRVNQLNRHLARLQVQLEAKQKDYAAIAPMPYRAKK